MIPLAFIVYGVLAVFIYYIIAYYRYVSKFPRGPMPFPLVGNFFQLSACKIHEELPKLAKEYGNVFTIWIPIPIVILADYESIKDAFIVKGEEFSGRPFAALSEDFEFCPNGGVINSNGESWRENRRHAISILRDFGMGKGLMEEKVKLSITEYLRCLADIKDKSAVDMRWPVQLMVANIINEVLFGYRYAYDDCKPLIDYVEAFAELIVELSSSLIRFAAVKFPWLSKVPIVTWFVAGRYRKTILLLKGYIDRNVTRALESYHADDEAECFVHAYQQRMESKVEGSQYLTPEQLKAVCADFFIAGQETTTTTLRWAMLLLASNQRVQDKLRAEILSVVGHNRLPAMADKPKMPYTAATALELQRTANILQLNVIHRTILDTEVLGHKIPKDTYVNGDIHTVLAHDPMWQKPDEFYPERYLNADGKTLNKDAVERTIPFSIGKRQCAGEGLARVEIFLGLAATVQHYKVLPSGSEPIDLAPIPFAVLLPKPQKLKLIPVEK